MDILRLESFILTADLRSEGTNSYIALHGASSEGPVEALCEFDPYFFVDARAAAHTKSDRKLRSLSGSLVKQLLFTSVYEAERVKREMNAAGISVFESDVKPRERFLMDRGINGGVIIEGEAEKRNGIFRFRNPTLTPSKTTPLFRVCSLDIETSITDGSVLSIAVHLSGSNLDERIVFIIGEPDIEASAIKTVPNEVALFASFCKWVERADPDIIIGWNVIGFDLAFLRNRAETLRVPLALGRDQKPFNISENTGRFSRAYVPGRIVLDGPQLLRTSFYSFESYSLENVSQAVLGEGKLIAGRDDKPWEIERLFREDKTALAAYNLKDAVLVTQIFEKLGLLDLTIKRTELSGMLLDQVGLSTASFDHFYLPRLHAAGFVAPDVNSVGEVEGAAGGYVMDPEAGIYDDIVALDFQSLYPSIIRTFNIDPLSRACAEDSPLTTPTGFAFSRKKAILPQFIGSLVEERRSAKEKNDKALSQAIKILMNSFYGVMGSSGCRFYHPALPSAITGTGQWLLLESKKWLEERGHKVIYGDTDSLFVQLSKNSDTNLEGAGSAIALALTDSWKERIRKDYDLESYLKLEFKKLYKKFLVPSARQAEGGAKKRYAGLVVQEGVEDLEFVGLEVVRSDSTKLARDFQIELYKKIFKGEPIDLWIRDFVDSVKSGSYDEKLVYRKRLHKPLSEYGKSPPPYARAAALLPKPTRDIRYVMTLKGAIPVELGPKDPDYQHYIDKQLKPVADSILEVLGTSFERMISKQLSLF